MDYRGHQVFIIHPDDELRETIVDFLREEEYETFGFGDTDPLKLDNRRESVIFLYTSDKTNWNCEKLVLALSDSENEAHFVSLGDTTSVDCFDKVLTETGDELLQAILSYLRLTGAQGHRHYVRFGSQNASIATFDFHHDDKRYAGIIHDISARGMSCTFRPEPEGSTPRKVTEMNLNLPGYRCSVTGRMISRRVVAGQIIHVFIFDQTVTEDTLHKLHDFIYASLSMKLSVH